MANIPIWEADNARDRLAQLGTDEQDVADAIAWARKEVRAGPKEAAETDRLA